MFNLNYFTLSLVLLYKNESSLGEHKKLSETLKKNLSNPKFMNIISICTCVFRLQTEFYLFLVELECRFIS